jgi:A/G-specific adenine glycosylase
MPDLPVLSDLVAPDLLALLQWYDRHRRRLPWRAEPGETADPYRVWLSEIMLQQTTVTAVIPYFKAFVARFPTASALAAAPVEHVLAAWAGLGYYARARNLHACAKVVAQGGFPNDQAGLLALPGIGPYTAAAVGAIAFGHNVIPVDGNVERVVARLFAITQMLPEAKKPIAAAARSLATQAVAQARPSDTAQALFDLGASLCTPLAPGCVLCPLTENCRARQAGIAAELPRKASKKLRPHRYGVHFWLQDAGGLVLLRRRPSRGLLGGMTELPGTAWRALPWDAAEAIAAAPMPAPWRPAGQVEHGFTHFTLTLDLFAARVPTIQAEGYLRDIEALATEALPSVMRKCVAAASGAIMRF